jgi:hypothetical protein
MTEYPELERYLDEVSAQLGRYPGKQDLLLELRSDALDRAEDLGGGEVTPDTMSRAVASMVEPAEVALAYRGKKYLIGPKVYRAFVLYTAILFAVHLVLLIVATVTGTGIEVFPLTIAKLERPHTLLSLVSVAIQALLLDIGLMVVIFTGMGRVRRSARFPSIAFRVPVGIRPSGMRAILAILVIVILNFLRNDLFIVVSEDRVDPLFSGAFADNLPWLNLLLGLVIARETAYAFLGERRWLVFADGLVSALGVALMIWFLTQPPFVALPNAEGTALLTLKDMMGKVMHLIILAFAVGFAVAATKRFIRAWHGGK